MKQSSRGGPLRVGFFYDYSEQSGLGHFARAKALAQSLAELTSPFQTELVPLPALESEPWADRLSEYDIVCLDSYRRDVQSLACLDSALRDPAKRIALICDSVWPGLQAEPRRCDRVTLILDPTFALEEASVKSRRLAGPEAVFLNKQSLEAMGSTVLPPLVSLGASASARTALPEVLKFFRTRWPSLCSIRPGSAYGRIRVDSVADELSMDEALARAPELVIAAGQMLWEAARLRENFWVLALTDLQYDALTRLIRHGICETIKTTTVAGLPAHHLRIPARTRQQLCGQFERAKQMSKILTEGLLTP